MTKQQRAKQLRYDKAYMRMAMEWAKLSYSQRKQVGAIIVKGSKSPAWLPSISG